MQLSCPYGHLDHLTQFGQVSIGDKIDCGDALEREVLDEAHPSFSFYPTECEYHQFPDEQRLSLEEKFAAQCYNKLKCQFTFDLSDLPISSCTLPQA